MRRALPFVLLGACGFSPTAAGTATGDAPTGVDAARAHDAPPARDAGSGSARPDAEPIDAAAPLPPCIAKWRSGTPPVFTNVRSAEVSFAGSIQRDPSLDPTELILYFSSDEASMSHTTNYWRATRARTDVDFDPSTVAIAPELDPNVNSASSEDKLTMTSDSLDVFFASDRPPGGQFWHAHRAAVDAGDPFGDPDQPADLTTVNAAGGLSDPTLSTDNLRLYYATTADTGHQHVVMSSRTARTAAFGAATTLASLDSGQGDADPALSVDETVIVFSSQRTGAQGTDLYFATRTSTAEPFGAPQKVAGAGLDTADNEGDPVLTHDGCTLFFATDRAGDYDIWTADMQLP